MHFSFVRNYENLTGFSEGSVVTIGSFDGVHLGHQAIIRKVKEGAEKSGLLAVALLFEPQPYEYFSGENAPARLMRMRDKVEKLLGLGLDRVVCLQFNERLRTLSANDFIAGVLVRGLCVKTLVIGDDFRFGADRTGDFALLQKEGRRLGFEVIRNPTVAFDGDRISSTRVRQVLERADFELAETLLGKPCEISGRVVYGQQLGRTLGIPTINVQLRRYRSPLVGVFAVDVCVRGHRVRGVANIGVRPTVGGLDKPILEVHLLDFSDRVYGEKVIVTFRKKIRDEQKFSSLDALKAQIGKDIESAQQFFG
ncbi:MAG: bifunctional riboflavin kinase/FAD synthetase [Pseudomonadales bacterium]|nr:bifunctional riboflavin kinase/FAD synthetase [Pseudomonadales bacterium]